MKRQSMLRYGLAILLIITMAVFAGCAVANNEQPKEHSGTSEKAGEEKHIGPSAEEAKAKLVAGNERYVSGQLEAKDLSEAKRQELAEKGQKPFAIILTCSDSRVPPELLFNQGLGDIFVIRTAGNVVDPIAIGSIEYGVEHLKAPLLVVLGHEKCGAVKATIEAGDAAVEGNIGAIVEKIRPSVKKVKAAGITGVNLPEAAANENVKEVMEQLDQSPVIKELVEKGELTVMGAKYHLGSGQVEWLE